MSSIAEGWWIPESSPSLRTRHPRWLLGEYRGYVRYSARGLHRMCKIATFQRWRRRYHAKHAHELGEELEPRLKSLTHDQNLWRKG